MRLRSYRVPNVYARFFAFIFFTCLSITSISFPAYADPSCAANQIGGTVFIDEDVNGIRDASEPDIDAAAAIQIFAYDASSATVPVASGLIGQASGDGDYLLTLPPTSTNPIRIEFELPAALLEIASARFANNGSNTTVSFVDMGNCNLDLGIQVIRPGTVGTQALSPYTACDPTNVELTTSCFVFSVGELTAGARDTVVSFPYQSGTTNAFPEDTTSPIDVANMAVYDAPSHPTEALSDNVGNVYGMAYHRRSDSIFVAAYLKRHSGFGSGGTGAIYRIDRTIADTDPARYSIIATIPNAGADPHPTTGVLDDWRRDSGSFALVGKSSLGDLDLDDAEENLWVMNLNDRRLYRVNIGANEPTASSVTAFPTNGNFADVATAAGQPCATRPTSEIRPFAVDYHGEQVYVGITCTAETETGALTEGRDEMRFLIYRYDPTTAGTLADFTLVLDIPVRDAAAYPNNTPAPDIRRSQPWNRWNTVFADSCEDTPDAGNGFDAGFCSNPQPILADIEFDDNNDMILGFRDRWGDMTGYLSFNPLDASDPATYSGIATGDILRACITGAANPLAPVNGDYLLEDNAQCGGITTAGANRVNSNGAQIGPNGGAYYFEDYWYSLPLNSVANVGFGGIALLPASGEVVMTAQDPIPSDPGGSNSGTSDAGIVWLSNTTGERTRSYRILDTNPPGSTELERIRTFGKANGLGDLEIICTPNLEIGNRVWIDTNNNGIQDSNEVPVAGVTVTIYEDVNGDGIAQASEQRGTMLTDANGQFLFNEGNVVETDSGGSVVYQGLQPYTSYLIVVNNPADFAVGGPLEGLLPTLPNIPSGTTGDVRDSDGVNAAWMSSLSYSAIEMETAGLGQNNHTYDFGFNPLVVPTPTPTQTPTSTPITPAATSAVQTPVPTTTSSTGTSTTGDITVTITSNPPFTQPGGEVTWTVTITNNGDDSEDFDFTTTLNDNLEIISVSGSASVSGNTVTISGTLDAHASTTVIIRTRVGADTPVPFVITTQVGGASASVLSVSELPNTGEPSRLRQWLLLLVAVATLGFVGYWRLRTTA
jgi:hypothetical protein